jgi:hypothetical protein
MSHQQVSKEFGVTPVVAGPDEHKDVLRRGKPEQANPQCCRSRAPHELAIRQTDG